MYIYQARNTDVGISDNLLQDNNYMLKEDIICEIYPFPEGIHGTIWAAVFSDNNAASKQKNLEDTSGEARSFLP